MAAMNSRVFRSASQRPVSGYAHWPLVSGFRSSKMPCTMRELKSNPSIFFPCDVRPSYVGQPLMQKASPRIETSVFLADGPAGFDCPTAAASLPKKVSNS